MVLRAIAVIGTVGFLSTVSGDAQVRASKRDAQTMTQKVAAIAARGERASNVPLRTTVTESEVNSYLAYELGDALPQGVVDPSVTILGMGRLTGRAVVDLDAVRQASKTTSMLDPRSYLGGQLPVTATGVLRATNGAGRFDLESASVGGVPIPKLFLQEIVAYYSKSPERPNGISLDEEFPLPARIREILVERGQAVVVQ
jgi:hypothetical protein